MGVFRLAIGIHNHQPVGNFQAIFEEAHQRAYLPFLNLLQAHRSIRLSLHQSGILWQWQKKAHPEFFESVGQLVDRGQIELLTGGFYEPILPAIPERDALGQIRLLTSYLTDHFETAPKGAWIAERVWEPHLPRVLAEAGVTYVPLDDTHFLYAGFEADQLCGPYVTENEGRAIRLLPIQQKLRYLIPFGRIEDIIEELRLMAERCPDGVAVYADDGEKFGIWPQTHAHCYNDGWLHRFFEALASESDWLEVVPLGEAAAMPPLGQAYLPSASYAEMLQWSLPPSAYLAYEQFEAWLKESGQWERYRRFVRGGHWRGFLTKYDEANFMHKKMLAVSSKLDEYDRTHPENRAAADRARDRLYAGQCNCPYWHGVFGGLYLPHIRQAVYGNLVEADTLLDKLLDRPPLEITAEDYDADGNLEVRVDSDRLAAVFRPRRGAALIHLGVKEHNFDVTDTLTRRREGYHFKIDSAVVGPGRRGTEPIHDRIPAKESGLGNLLIEDWYTKRCFLDHFLTSDVDFDRFASNKYGEEGDFIIEPFSFEIDSDNGQATFTRDGHLWRPDQVVPLRLTKRFGFRAGSERIAVTYELSCPKGHEVTVNFGIEHNFNFQAGHAEDRFVLIDGHRPENSFLDKAAAHEEAGSYALLDQYRDLGVAVTCDRRCQVWRLPIWTVSLSESGFEKVYQGTTMMTVYRLKVSKEPVVLAQTLFVGDLTSVSGAVAARPGVRS